MARRTGACLLALAATYFSLVAGQFLQDYEPQTRALDANGSTELRYLYRTTPNTAPQAVIELLPQSVYLIYNCYYLIDACKNAENYFNLGRGRYGHDSGVPPDVFGYDLNSKRGDKRRRRVCPGGQSGWASRHACPETNQRLPWRQDAQQWYTTALEQGTAINQIGNRYDDSGRLIEESGIRWSCNDFPAAAWIEGGDNVDGSSPAETRCAAVSCKPQVWTEQTWQAQIHAQLRAELVAAAERVGVSGFQATESIVFFNFLMDNRPDGVAARVFTYPDPSLSHLNGSRQIAVSGTLGITRRRVGDQPANIPTMVQRWPARLSISELHELIGSNEGREISVAANETYGVEAMGAMMSTIRPDLRRSSTHESARDAAKGRRADESPPVRSDRSRPARQLETRTSRHHIQTPLLRNASSADLRRARDLVAKALAASAKLNKVRLENPRRNRYSLKPGTDTGSSPSPPKLRVRDSATVGASTTPLLHISDEIARAAALVAEADAIGTSGSNITRRPAGGMGTYWMGSIARKGIVPWGNDPNYAVFRNVLWYGAVGDGVTDDTAAIKRTMLDGNRCAERCNGATTKNAIVYFPPGTYLISSSILMPFGTQVIGDANDRPRLLASAHFVGLGVLSTDQYTGGGSGPDGQDQEFYINTANFYRQIRNIVIDIRGTRPEQKVACLHYQVAQATSLENVELIAGDNMIGMFAENGSGGQIADVTFTGGAVGLLGGSQQFTAQRLKFNGCGIGAQIFWDWGWVWKSITMTNVGIGFKLAADDSPGSVGSAMFTDSSFTNVQTAILISPPSSPTGSGSTGVVLQNVALFGVSRAVADTSGTILLMPTPLVDDWVLGPVYGGSANASARSFSDGHSIGGYTRPPTLINADGSWYERAKPQYEDRPASDFVHVRDFGAFGNGVADDTAAFQAALYASLGKVLFVDAGSYILTSTVTIPNGVKIVGETWSQLVASGPNFQDASHPQVMLRVGNPGEVGSVEMQDLLFTTKDATAGVVLVEWNIRSASPGAAGLWDCHARLGGALGTELTPTECPPISNGINPGCSAASLMFHLTASGSGYFENMWLWGADHMIDDPDLLDANNTMPQISIYVARGFLIESTHATWLYGTASEHSVFYQYNFHKAANVYATMIQTESPYFQPNPQPPAPFTSAVGVFASDPDYTCDPDNEFGGCDDSWAVIVRKSANILIAGAGLYSWFSNYSQSCLETKDCQKALVLLDSNHAGVRFQHLVTIGAKYMVVMNGKGIASLENLSLKSNPYNAQISILDVASDGSQSEDIIWIDPVIWDMAQPQFTCVPPCHVKIPPWTGATSTVNYPLLTVSSGSWTSTITKAPMTISQWIFEIVTIQTEAGAFTDFWPSLATTPGWPTVKYRGPDGLTSQIVPTIPFPTPPINMLGPNTLAAPAGSWPTSPIRPVAGVKDSPVVPECGFWDPECLDGLWYYGDNGKIDGGGGSDDMADGSGITCPRPTNTSAAGSPPTPTSSGWLVSSSPLQVDNPMQNSLECYTQGQRTEYGRLDDAASYFCGELGAMGLSSLGPKFYHETSYELPAQDGGSTGVNIVMGFGVRENCEMRWSMTDCLHYFSVPINSCNCGSVNGKQGGVLSNNCLYVRVDPNTRF